MMDVQSWITCQDVPAMIKIVETKASERKLRLLAVANAISHLGDMPAGGFREAVLAAELYADGILDDCSFSNIRKSLYMLPQPEHIFWEFTLNDNISQPNLARHTAIMTAVASNYQNSRFSEKMAWVESSALGRILEPWLIHEIFGNPFASRPKPANWLNDSIVKLAKKIYDNHNDSIPLKFVGMLEEAGCHDADILDHIKYATKHFRGCWVIDYLLGNQ